MTAIVRRLLPEQPARYAGFGEDIDNRMAVCLNGEIHQHAGMLPLTPASEGLSHSKDRRG